MRSPTSPQTLHESPDRSGRIPLTAQVTAGDYIHYQWTGSDANANNDGEGRQRTDRSNIVQYGAQDSNLPVKPQCRYPRAIAFSVPLQIL